MREMSLTPADWAGLCALTETDRPEEQEYVLWVIRYRVESPRFPDTYEGVILQPKQFSAFNPYTGIARAHWPPERVFDDVSDDYKERLLLAAVHLAEKVLGEFPENNLFRELPPARPGTTKDERMADVLDVAAALRRAQDVLHYYSPVSMKPAGSAPAWAKSAKRLFTPQGIDPQRFVFAEGVP